MTLTSMILERFAMIQAMLNESMDRAKPFERGQEQAEAVLGM